MKPVGQRLRWTLRVAALAAALVGWLEPPVARAATVNTLHVFTRADGQAGNLVQGSDGTLFGVISPTGSGSRTVFAISPDGSNYRTLYTTSSLTKVGGLVQGSDGALYLAALGAVGSVNGFLVIRVASDGSSQSVLYSSAFPVVPGDNQLDSINLISGRDGALYGVVSYGLQGQGSQTWNYTGWLFRLNTDGSGFRTLSNQVKNFTGAPVQLADGRICGFTAGSNPMAPTVDGGLYVASADGSSFNIYYRELSLNTNTVLFQNSSGVLCGAINGKLYQLAPDGSGYSLLFPLVMGIGCQGADGRLYGSVESTTPVQWRTWAVSTSIDTMEFDGGDFETLATFSFLQVGGDFANPPLGLYTFIVGRSDVVYGVASDSTTGVYLFSITPTQAAASAPVFIGNPTSVVIALGRSAVFNAMASGYPAPNYQWHLNGAVIPGADDPILFVNSATSANAGTYTCVATNTAGSVTSSAATLTVDSVGTPGFLYNISARGDVGPTPGNTSSGILFGGFAVSGTGAKQVVVRGLGPGMAYAFPSIMDPSQVVTDPRLALYDANSNPLSSNAGWATSGVTPAMMRMLGAYAIQSGSQDCALGASVTPGDYTAQVSTYDTGSLAGVGSVEIYDADQGARTAKITNLSARDYVGQGVHLLIGGIIIGGTDADTVLIRAVGPGLGVTFGLWPTLAQPGLTIVDSSNNVVFAKSEGWNGDRTIAEVSEEVGAFSLAADQADAVALISLAPGAYTALVTGLSGSTGQALIEFYEVP
jgi:Immunoglobulin domain